MKIVLSLFLSVIFVLVVSGQSGQQKNQIEVDVLAVLSAQTAAWNRGDLKGFMKGYWQSDKLMFVSGDEITLGWQPTLDRYQKNYGAKGQMGELTFSNVVVNVLSKDHAVAVGSWSLAREKDNPKGKFTVIFQRMKEGWRAIHDHSS